MRTWCLAPVALFVSACFSLSLASQDTAAINGQGLSLLQNSLAVLVGHTTIADVTLSGTVRRIAGSDDETGTAVLKALAAGPASVDLSLPSGPRSEVFTVANKCPRGSWSGPDGVFHPVANHNLSSDTSWFFPAFTIARLAATSKYIVSDAGQETWNGRILTHLLAYQSLSVPAIPGLPTVRHLTQMDLFLDSGTMLPARLDFNVHPDHNLALDIPVEIVFSDYRMVGGAQIPFHVQKFLNNTLALDLQFESATLNSGLPASAFTAGGGL